MNARIFCKHDPDFREKRKNLGSSTCAIRFPVLFLIAVNCGYCCQKRVHLGSYATVGLIISALLCLLTFGVAPVSSAQETNSTTIKIAAGAPGWVYWKAAEEVRHILLSLNPSLQIELVQTGGSAENMNLVAKGLVDLAMIQNNAVTEKRFFPSSVRGVSSLYTEAVQMFGVSNTFLETSADLHGLRIFVGEEGSGTRVDSRRVLNTLGAYRTDFHAVTEPFSRLSSLVENAEIDAVFMIDAIPSTDILAIPSSLHFLSMTRTDVADLLHRHAYLVPFSIPVGTYPKQIREVDTVGIRALLVAHESFPAGLVPELLIGMEHSSTFRALGKGKSEEWNAAVMASRGMTVPLHPAAREYFRYRVLIIKILNEWLPDILLMIVVACFWIGMGLSRARIFTHCRQNLYLRLIAVFASVYVLATSAIHLAEQQRTPGFDSLTESFWSTAVYVLSGLESREPRTMAGKFGLTVLLFASLGLLGSITGKFASLFMNERKNRMPDEIDRHIVICNWNSRGDKIVRELHTPEAVPETEIVVISTQDPGEDRLRAVKGPCGEDSYSRVFFVRSDPQLHEVLESAKIHLARSVILLSDEESPDPDANSVVVAIAVQNVCRQKGIQPADMPHVVAESANHRKVRHLKEAGVSEVVCASDYGLGILAQCSLHKHLSEVYDRLLHYSDDSNEIYVVEGARLPKWIHGHSYDDVNRALSDHRDKENPSIALGVLTADGEIKLNPKGGRHACRFDSGDMLITMSFTRPDLRDLPEPTTN